MVLQSVNRRGELVRAKKLLCPLAVKKWGCCGTAVALYLGVAGPAVNRLANAEELKHVNPYGKLF